MITEQEIQRAFDFLRDSAPLIAMARHDKVKSEEMRKVVWSQLRRQCEEKTQAEKDAFAYAHGEYLRHIDDMADAARRFEFLKAKREAAIALIDAWRTMSANERGAARAA